MTTLLPYLVFKSGNIYLINSFTTFGNHNWKWTSILNNRKEYEISVLKALADEYSRKILMATIPKAMSVQDIIRKKRYSFGIRLSAY